MKRASAGPILSTIFVDYDNIYLSLKRKNEDAAKRFAKDSAIWLQAIVSGDLITPTSLYAPPLERRLAMTRCYGNSTPRRNAHDNSTDMNSFPFVKHHFLRAGFEIVDCPPMTQQLKNAADIRMVLEIGDILGHPTFFDEIIILSGDADFTPLLHRLRAHARRSIVFANDQTAQPYTAISDGEIRESGLISVLLQGSAITADTRAREIAAPQAAIVDIEAARRAILAEVVGFVRAAPQAVPLETLADRAVRIIGRDKTVGTNWGSFGSFRDLLLSDLPDDIHLSDTAPYTVFDGNRHISPAGLIAPQPDVTETAPIEHDLRSAQFDNAAGSDRAFRPAAQQPFDRYAAAAPSQPAGEPYARRVPAYAPQAPSAPIQQRAPVAPPAGPAPQANHVPQANLGPQRYADAPAQHAAFPAPTPQRDPQHQLAQHQVAQNQAPLQRDVAPAPAAHQPPSRGGVDQATQIQHSIARIHDACQAPALAPAEYRVLFEILSLEISNNGLQGAQTLVNLTQRAREYGLDLKRDDLRFILEVVSESDPWFEQGASANLFASRFRNFVVARCRSQGLALSSDELDLVEAWFSAQPAQPQRAQPFPASNTAQRGSDGAADVGGISPSGERWWSLEEGRQHIAGERGGPALDDANAEDEFPRIVRSRLRG